jgi:hypothetical protein
VNLTINLDVAGARMSKRPAMPGAAGNGTRPWAFNAFSERFRRQPESSRAKAGQRPRLFYPIG